MEWNNDKKSADIMPYTYVWTSDGRLQIQGQVPARLDSIQAANMLGFNPADLVVLKKHKILFPMGQVPHKGRKAYQSNFYSTVEVIALASDPERLHHAQHVISEANAIKAGRMPKPTAKHG